MHARRERWIANLALLTAMAASSGCGGRFAAGGGPVLSSGSYGVGGIEHGVGVGLDASVYARGDASSLGAALSLDMAGYAAGNDADPIIWPELGSRYRWFFGDSQASIRPFAAAGLGAGVTIGPGTAVVAAGFGEVGVRMGQPGGAALVLSVRERPAYFMGGGDPFGEFHNSLQAFIGLGL